MKKCVCGLTYFIKCIVIHNTNKLNHLEIYVYTEQSVSCHRFSSAASKNKLKKVLKKAFC